MTMKALILAKMYSTGNNFLYFTREHKNVDYEKVISANEII